MKKFALCLMVACLSLTFMPLKSSAATNREPAPITAPKPAESAEAKALLLRLDEIKAMDMSKLKSEDKKNLRKEVKSIKRNLKDIGTGVYLSGAAVILIIILLIVLL